MLVSVAHLESMLGASGLTPMSSVSRTYGLSGFAPWRGSVATAWTLTLRDRALTQRNQIVGVETPRPRRAAVPVPVIVTIEAVTSASAASSAPCASERSVLGLPRAGAAADSSHALSTSSCLSSTACWARRPQPAGHGHLPVRVTFQSTPQRALLGCERQIRDRLCLALRGVLRMKASRS